MAYFEFQVLDARAQIILMNGSVMTEPKRHPAGRTCQMTLLMLPILLPYYLIKNALEKRKDR